MTLNPTRPPKANRCQHCKVRLPAELARHKLHPECVDPWWAIQRGKQERARVKAAKVRAAKEKRETKEKLAKFKTIAKLIAEAQFHFNAYIRLRDKDKGCFVCLRPFTPEPGRVQHAGHVRSRGAAGHLRFNEENCHGECEGCNGPHGAKPHEIKAGAIARIGADRFEALEADNEPHKWAREELISIKTHYAALVREMKARTE